MIVLFIQSSWQSFPLLAIGRYLFEKSKFLQKFHLDYFLFVRLLRTYFSVFYIVLGQIEDLYHENNPYHNALHAADVTQATYCLLKRLRVEGFISAFDFMCALLAAICHDIDHPGVNQAFLIKTKQMLSIFYEESVLEHHHSNVCISVLLQSQCHLKRLILATDISKQEEYLDRLEVRLSFDIMAIKCADISNPCRHWEACLQWANCITEEFFQQGDRENLLALPVLPLMNRKKTTKAKVQIGFIQFQVLPLFEQWDAYVRSKFTRSLVAKCKKNLAVWLARDTVATGEQHANLFS
ncbi:unnamed protein product [Hydatigera taeniaeformis]|uniref:PDEase domain-containing protein n=1 Tax=Hydatigena taeniaeformis TaxID=6205 RepID=A0A3P7F447_HYDTA|nr:unnamed protein product [Hydatigera taeniaeformis]